MHVPQSKATQVLLNSSIPIFGPFVSETHKKKKKKKKTRMTMIAPKQ